MFELKNKFINFVNQKILIEYSFILIITTYLTTIKFEDFFNSKGQLVIGNYGDPRYILFMVEHFYQSLNINFLNIINPPNLFPYKWTISLSDWLLFPGFFHAFFRTLGLDLFNSFEYSLILCNSLFFIFLYFAIRKISGINRIFSLYISLLISYGRFLFDYRYWLQNFVVFFGPLLFLFLFESINNQNLEKSNYLRFLNRNLISGLIVMFTLFSNFYLGASLLMITFLNFVIDRILSFKKNKPFQNYVFKNIFS